ncbi:MAG: recombinase family protein [Kiritimatiellae bacterium]|nr:recombinase family protein [Kiritimatiellia bacterium]
MKTCIIYARVSTSDQECQNQIDQLKDYAGKQGWQVLEAIVDVCSGGKGIDERPGLEKVFMLAHKKKFDVLLFWALDRLSREGSRKTIEYLTRLDEYKIDWHSFTEPYLSSMGVFSDCIISLLSTLARQEKIRIGERTRAGLARARLNGKTLGRRRTAGDKSARAVLLREQGLSFSSIGKELGISKVRAFHLVKDAAKYLVQTES